MYICIYIYIYMIIYIHIYMEAHQNVDLDMLFHGAKEGLGPARQY